MTVHLKIDQEFTTSPIVALHSSASSGNQWKMLAQEVADRYEVHAPDLPGYGPVRAFNGRVAALPMDPAAQVIGQIVQLGKRVHLVGHSNGGGIALKVALMRPDLVESLTVYEPATFHFLKEGDREDRKFFAEINMISAIVTTGVASARPDLGMRRFIDFWSGNGTWAQVPAQRKERFAAMAIAVMNDFARGFAETWSLADLRRLNMPVRIITGERSPALARHVACKIATSIPNAECAEIQGAGHMGPVTDARFVNRAILGHLSTVEQHKTGNEAEVRTAA